MHAIFSVGSAELNHDERSSRSTLLQGRSTDARFVIAPRCVCVCVRERARCKKTATAEKRQRTTRVSDVFNDREKHLYALVCSVFSNGLEIV